MSVNIGTVACMDAGFTQKETAVKVLEEAAEAFAAWQECRDYEDSGGDLSKDGYPLSDLISECADVIQAVCDLLDMMGVHDMRQAMAACKQRNEARGRVYEPIAECHYALGDVLDECADAEGYVKLPVDADGVPIRIGDEVYFVGGDIEGAHVVNGYRIAPDESMMFFTSINPNVVSMSYMPKLWTHEKPEPPDSWEKLEKDVSSATACLYIGALTNEEGNTTCDGCPFEESGNCGESMARHVFSRAKVLAGVSE